MISDKAVIYEQRNDAVTRRVLAIRVVLGSGYKLFNTTAVLECQFPVLSRSDGAMIGNNVEVLKLERQGFACHLATTTCTFSGIEVATAEGCC